MEEWEVSRSGGGGRGLPVELSSSEMEESAILARLSALAALFMARLWNNVAVSL